MNIQIKATLLRVNAKPRPDNPVPSVQIIIETDVSPAIARLLPLIGHDLHVTIEAKSYQLPLGPFHEPEPILDDDQEEPR